jgi:hypothetical protein
MKKVKPHAVDWAQLERFLASSDRKLDSTHKIPAFEEEACLRKPDAQGLQPKLTKTVTENAGENPPGASRRAFWDVRHDPGLDGCEWGR